MTDETAADQASSATPPRMPMARFLGYFAGLGTWGFGGPIASVGYIQRRWRDESALPLPAAPLRAWPTCLVYRDGERVDAVAC